MQKVLVVVNSSAGRKQAIKNKKHVLNFLFKNNLKFRFTTLDEIDNIENFEYDTILVMGGDGTINKVLPLLIKTNATLGILPCGTANLLGANLGIPNNIKKSLKIIEKNTTKEINIAKINDKYSILRIGFGYDSDIICKTPQSLKNKFGYFAYFIAGILFGFRLKNKTYEMVIDNNNMKINASCIIIANASNMFRNIVSISKNSKLDDNLLDIFILKTQNPILFFIEFLRILFNDKENGMLAEYLKGKNIKIANKWSCFHIDGEKMKLDKDIEISLVPQKIKVFGKK